MMLVKIDGMDKLERILKKIPDQARGAVKYSLRRISLDLKGKAMRRAPVKKGFLRRSAFSASDDRSLTVGFTEVYATRQHEETTWKHPKGGQAKYLEKPLEESLDSYIRVIEQAVAEAMGGT